MTRAAVSGEMRWTFISSKPALLNRKTKAEKSPCTFTVSSACCVCVCSASLRKRKAAGESKGGWVRGRLGGGGGGQVSKPSDDK